MRRDAVSEVDWSAAAPMSSSGERSVDGAAGIEVSINDVTPEVFDGIVATASDGSYEQTSIYVHGQWGRRAERCLVRHRGVVVGGAVVVKLTLPLIEKGLAYIKYGPFWRLGGEMDIEHYATVVAALARHYCDERGFHLSLLPRPNPDFMAAEIAALEEAGFRASHDVADPNRYLVNVGLTSDELLAGLAQKWRYNLRKAFKSGLEVEQSESPAAIDAFTDLHREMVARKRHDDVDSIELLPDMIESLPAGIAPRLYLARRHGKPVVGAVVGCLGDTAYYLFGSSAADALPLKAGYALQWFIAEALTRDPAIRWYDLGGEAMSDGLRQFKRGFVGRSGAIVEMGGEFHAWRMGVGTVAARAVFALRNGRRWLKQR